MTRLREFVENGNKVRNFEMDEDAPKVVKEMYLLTDIPMLYVCNVSEDDIPDASSNEEVRKVREYAAKEGSEVIVLSAKIEAEIAELPYDEKKLFLNELGLENSGLDRLVRIAYDKLGIITYFTQGPKEVRAWTIRKGWKAPQAAGVIHTDFERGFIRAETASYDDFITAGSEAALKEAGKMRSEGKEYVVKDGDIMLFRFNV